MTNKDKERIQELKQIALVLFVGVILATGLMAYSANKATNLEQELQSCQEELEESKWEWKTYYFSEPIILKGSETYQIGFVDEDDTFIAKGITIRELIK